MITWKQENMENMENIVFITVFLVYPVFFFRTKAKAITKSRGNDNRGNRENMENMENSENNVFLIVFPLFFKHVFFSHKCQGNKESKGYR